jgi:hypothetical protein
MDRRRLPRTAAVLATRLRARDGWRVREWQEQAHIAVKAVLAAGLAWELGLLIGSEHVAYFAPITALVAIHPTVASSLRESAAYATSVLAGVLLAAGVDAVMGSGLAAVVTVVAVGFALGSLRWFGRSGGTMSFWALLVIIVGATSPVVYLSQRLPEAALGLAVGAVVNLVAFPRVRLGHAESWLRRLRESLATGAEEMSQALTEDWPPSDGPWEALDGWLEDGAAGAREAVGRASESMRLNPRSRRHGRWPLERQDRELLEGLDRMATAMRAIGRTLDAAARHEGEPAALEEAFRVAYAELLGRLGEPIRVYGSAGDTPEHRASLAPLDHELRRLEESIAAERERHRGSWLTEALLLLELDHIQAELDRSGGRFTAGPWAGAGAGRRGSGAGGRAAAGHAPDPAALL